jgi:hypothetical protein
MDIAALDWAVLVACDAGLLTPPEPADAIGSLFRRLETSSDDSVGRPWLLVNCCTCAAPTSGAD